MYERMEIGKLDNAGFAFRQVWKMFMEWLIGHVTIFPQRLNHNYASPAFGSCQGNIEQASLISAFLGGGIELKVRKDNDLVELQAFGTMHGGKPECVHILGTGVI